MSPICTPRHHKAKLETPAISHRDWIRRSALLWSQEPSSPQHNFSKAKGLLVYTLLCSLGIASFPEVAAACKRFAKSIALKMSIVFRVVFRKFLPTSCRCYTARWHSPRRSASNAACLQKLLQVPVRDAQPSPQRLNAKPTVPQLRGTRVMDWAIIISYYTWLYTLLPFLKNI